MGRHAGRAGRGPLARPKSHASVQLLDDWTTGLIHSVSAGNDRLLVFVVGAEHGTPPIGSITGVTWGGQALTPVGSAAVTNVEENRLEVWYLDEAGVAAAGATAS